MSDLYIFLTHDNKIVPLTEKQAWMHAKKMRHYFGILPNNDESLKLLEFREEKKLEDLKKMLPVVQAESAILEKQLSTMSPGGAIYDNTKIELNKKFDMVNFINLDIARMSALPTFEDCVEKLKSMNLERKRPRVQKWTVIMNGSTERMGSLQECAQYVQGRNKQDDFPF